MKDLLREMFFGFVAIAMFIEFVGGDLNSLLFAIDRVMAIHGISESLAYRHMLWVAFWNLIACAGSSMVYYTLRCPEKSTVGRWGVVLTTVGLIGYTINRLWLALAELDEPFYMLWIAGGYGLFGLSAGFLGAVLFNKNWRPLEPVQRDPGETTAMMKIT